MKPASTNLPTEGSTAPVTKSPSHLILSEREWREIARALRLSEREVQMLQCIFDDLTEAGAARELNISPHTVHTHLERLYRKLQVTSRCAAVVRVFAEYVHRKTPSV